MTLSASFKSCFIYVVALLHMVLYVYAAVNKVVDFENFQVQLGQSPLLSAYAGFVSYAVPVVELVIVGLLFFGRTRYLGLYASLCLMVMFTSYIFIMLHFSPFVPCSCGGILEKLSWNQHLLFNLSFFILNLSALLLHDNPKTGLFSKKMTALAGLFLSIVVVVVLFLLSENVIHHRNNFTRRFPKHPTTAKKSIELPYSSYYIAGYDAKHIYLGNRTAPLLVTIYDLNLNKKKEVRIDLPRMDFPYKAPRLTIKPPYFYFTDGTVPCVFVGDTLTWKAELRSHTHDYFSAFLPINKETAVVRAVSSKTKQNVLGLLSFGGEKPLSLHQNLLKKQVDGLFDTSGQLVYNAQTHQIVYTYFYRNQFLIMNPKLELLLTGKTIDTISKAQVKVAKIKSKNQNVLAEQPLLVNRLVATYGNYLFVNSALIGKHEPKIMWDKASIIDVYHLKNNTYAFSFYLYHKQGINMDEFIVIDDYVVNLNGRHLTIERLKTDYYKPW
ncbi:MauE/DoxX family redox-associated membrane protein [Flavobacterium sp. UBA7682]|uniref:MauE/DoxX family redox-associated membrane protein n=1 Tax=Flavobacterium sp. UBA7682 TaxID=1946560 RepID=UPI0025C42BAF|nr:MauE/DoxX family redox-associated membrane protein [Flavobacterium sp. UBA7682]